MKKYPKEVGAFIKENVSGRTSAEVAELVNRAFGTDYSAGDIKNYKSNHRLRSGTRTGVPKGTPSKLFPQLVKDYIHANYKGTGHRAMAERLNSVFGTNYTELQIKSYYHNHKLNSGLSGHFEKGSVPVNKGRKGYFPPGSEKGWFPKGNLPANTKPIGHERITKDGYIEVKVAMRPSNPDSNDNYKAKHRLVWEKLHGPIPEGSVIIFKNGNKTDCSPENLELVTRGELIQLTKKGLRSSDPELTETGVMVARLLNTIYEKKRKGRKT